ncbi:small RNA 2'-O-methyltransferase [Hydra vulgaris]|uniref:Small RNA 2'-O-methyltransferase n=1 Tax=Hydra vulgaris TaxID=6087 RepID=A0ABM4CR37_HYDVU
MEITRESVFNPPLFKQRYEAVAQIINKMQAKSVLDIGCSDGKFLTYMKEKCTSVEKIIGVDIDRSLLESNTYFLQPKPFEYIVKRAVPLNISLFCGSITQSDVRFHHVDLISCIEVIEHLYDDVLSMVPYNIFGILKPKAVVMTTPNAEYNQLFKGFSGLRHNDHKFEWTRNQFQQWCMRIERTYGYVVEFDGVGAPPADSKVGYCSQIAVFRQTDNKIAIEHNDLEYLMDLHSGVICHHVSENDGVCHRSLDEAIVPLCQKFNCNQMDVCYCTSYKTKLNKYKSFENAENFSLVYQVEYPYDNLSLNLEQKILDEIGYNIFLFFSDTDDQVEEVIEKRVPVKFFHSLSSIAKFNVNCDQLTSIIRQKFRISDDNQHVIFNVTLNSRRWYNYSDDDSEEEDEKRYEPSNEFIIGHIEEEESWD